MPAGAHAVTSGSDSAVAFVDAPATRPTSGPTAARTARQTSTCSSALSVGASPVVPVTTRPSEPEATSARASSASASQSTAAVRRR